jgi:hypothetical protein
MLLGTVATPVLLELRLKVMPPVGAAAERISVRVAELPLPVMDKLVGESVRE